MIQIYVGCSLTQAPGEFRQGVEDLKSALRREGYDIPDFLGLVAGTPLDVYEVDIHERVAQCDMLLAICDFPSIGLGWEMGTAVEKHRKPVLAVVHRKTQLTRLVVGADCARNPLYRFEQYDDWEEVIALVDEFIRAMLAVR